MPGEDKAYDVEVSFLYPDLVQGMHEDVRRHFEPMVRATDALPEVHLLASLCLRQVRLCRATRAVAMEGLMEESQMPLRSATESLVNLLYIMEVGPALGDKDTRSLATQFMSYGHVAYYKLLSRRPNQARSTFRRRKAMSDEEYDRFLDEKKRLRDEAIAVHGCTSRRWHQSPLDQMAERVRDNAPDYVDQGFADMLLSSFVSTNSATHSDALSLRSSYAGLGNEPLELTFVADGSYPTAAAMMALWSWRAMARYFGQEKWLEDAVNETMRGRLLAKLEAAEEVEARRVFRL